MSPIFWLKSSETFRQRNDHSSQIENWLIPALGGRVCAEQNDGNWTLGHKVGRPNMTRTNVGRKRTLTLDTWRQWQIFKSKSNRSLADVAPDNAVRYSGFMKPKGLFRERNGWGDQHSVRVKYDERQELDLSENRYRERGYQPPFDQLAWKDDPANDA